MSLSHREKKHRNRHKKRLQGNVAITKTVIFQPPYSTVKARMQVQTKATANSDPSTTYSSTSDAFVKIVRHEGVLGLYQGISSKLLQSVLTAAFLFMFKEQLFGEQYEFHSGTGHSRQCGADYLRMTLGISVFLMRLM